MAEEVKTTTELFGDEAADQMNASARNIADMAEQERILDENAAKLAKQERDKQLEEVRKKANAKVTTGLSNFLNILRGPKAPPVEEAKVQSLSNTVEGVKESKSDEEASEKINTSENTSSVTTPMQGTNNIPSTGSNTAPTVKISGAPAVTLIDETNNALQPGSERRLTFNENVEYIGTQTTDLLNDVAARGPEGEITAADIGRCRKILNNAYNAAKCVKDTVGSGLSNVYNFLTSGQSLVAIALILIMGGVGYIGYEKYQSDTALSNALDKFMKAILGLNKQNTDGCFLITSSDYIRLDDECSTWYSTGDNKFSCRCGTLTDTKINPDCSTLSGDRDCSAPYCLGQASCTVSNPLSPSPQPKCYTKDNKISTLPPCTSKDRNDPNFISYAYSDSLPLEPYVTTYLVNKQIYDQYYNSSQDKTLMYVSIGISVLSLLVLVFFIIKYYMKKKK